MAAIHENQILCSIYVARVGFLDLVPPFNGIPIFPELRAWLDALPHQKGPLLLNSRGKGWTTSGLESVFQRQKPDGFDRTMHDIRGTFVTWLAIKGLTDEEISRIVGWTAKRVSGVRARYVDEARVIVSLVDRLSG